MILCFWETNQRVLPKVGNFLHFVEWIEQEMISPFIPVDGHWAISVHTENQANKTKSENRFASDHKNSSRLRSVMRDCSLLKR